MVWVGYMSKETYPEYPSMSAFCIFEGNIVGNTRS